MIIKPFDRQGNYTAIDNAVIDEIMPTLTSAEWMVLSLIIRKTIGWHKDIDGISYSQFIENTSIKSNTTIKKAVDGLIEKGLIELGKATNPNEPHYYRLNKEYSIRSTESVERPITFSVERPPTENVDTKESLKENKTTAAVYQFYENNIGGLSTMLSELISDAADEHGPDVVIEAMGEAVKSNVRRWNYVEAILKNWKQNGRVTYSPAQNGQSKHDSAELLVNLVKTHGRHGLRAKEKLSSDDWKIVEAMGGWANVHTMTEETIKIKYYQKRKEVAYV